MWEDIFFYFLSSKKWLNLLFTKSHANFLNIFHCIFSVGVIFIWVCWTNVLVNTVPFLYIVKVLHANKNRTVICSRWDKIGHNFCYLATFTMYNKGIVFTSTFVQHTQMKLTPTENMQRKMFRKSARDLFS